ncbi:MAG: YceI family protein [Phycisphaeraceae bacterium]|nr:YceI family protein [Phycisphaeraceae bacterium]MCB9846951.1 YceI family protein [Phycisphaeraceae bacterium]
MTRTIPSSRPRTVLGALAAAGCLLALPLTSLGEAPATEQGFELVVPADHAAMGTVFHALKGRDAQVTFTSDAPLEYIKGTSNQVIGYAVAGEGGHLLAGEFHLPVASLDTGIPMRNEHVQSNRWLNAESHPDVIFQIAETTDIKLAKTSDTFTTYDVTLVGDMTINGVTREMSIPATVTRMPESDATKVRFPGDLLAIRCSYPILLSDFEVGVGDAGIAAGKVSNELMLETRLFCSSASPESVMSQRRR